MSIIKIKKRENPYVQIDRRVLENAEMSWQAKGMLAYMLSKPDDWEIRVADLVKRGKQGRDAVYAILEELKGFGHLEVVPRRNGGRFAGNDYVVHESPLTDIPYTVEPDSEKPDHSNKEVSKKENSTPQTPQGEEGPAFDVFWNKYDKKQGRQASEKEWKKLKAEERVRAVAYIDAYRKLQPEKKYRKDPERYLKHKLWLDAEPVKASERKLIGHHYTLDFATSQEVLLPVYEGDPIPRIGFRPLSKQE